MVITATGYYATGSGAVYDLLKEYSSCSQGVFENISCEHLILYTPNGLFDLEDKLLVGNNIHRSDEAIHAFRTEMLKLYSNDFIWFGNYKKYFGKVFLEEVDKFMDEIMDFNVSSSWYYDYYDTKFSFVKVLKNAVKTVLHKPYSGDFSKRILINDKHTISYSFVENARFYAAAKKFVSSYIHLSMTDAKKKLILDHFILPHNLYRLPNYFDDDIRIFVVERDPRDVYIECMRHLKQGRNNICIPMQIDDYISFWRNLRRIEQPIEDNRICRIWFEDLLYFYDETVRRIEDFCGLDGNSHIEPKKYFVPEKSIKNTRLYVDNTEYKEEIEKIERELPEYLYKG